MNMIIEPFTIEDIQKVVHDFDLINRPYVLYYNPKDNNLLQKVKLLSGDDCFLLPQREYVGTITMNRCGEYRTRGECIDGDPEYFYRSAIVAWKTIE